MQNVSDIKKMNTAIDHSQASQDAPKSFFDTMFDLPSLEGVEEVVISKEVVEGTARPLYIYADRADRAGDASAS
jgi:hypothetical protein